MDRLYSDICDLLDDCTPQLSNLKPSEWAEKYRIMSGSDTPFPGPFSYSKNPPLRDIVDCFHYTHPAKKIAIKKGSQFGVTTAVIENAIGWIISENPGNILFLTGHAELTKEAISGKLDNMIDSTGLRKLMKSTAKRVRNNKTGDTNVSKEFPGGSLVSGAAGNHNLMRQRSIKFGIVDDFDAAKRSSKDAGSISALIETRFTAYDSSMKLLYVSTPQIKGDSNIEEAYLLGDQQRLHLPCPLCKEKIVLEWEIDIADTGRKAGITWQLDDNNRVIPESVGYTCQKCEQTFDETYKQWMLDNYEWIPTAIPSEPGYYSFDLNSLNSASGMISWEGYIYKYLQANPPGQPRIEAKWQTFQNTVLAQTYEPPSEDLKANDLMMNNQRSYQIGVLPEQMSIADGNGKIMLLTCAADLNGTEDDARLDWEIVAHTESGSTYSIDHGSIGTFVPREGKQKNRADREHWSYHYGKENNVWPEFEKVLARRYETDTGKSMSVQITAIDTAYQDTLVWHHISVSNHAIVGVRGNANAKFVNSGADLPTFKRGRERANLYIIESNVVKDDLADCMKLRWDAKQDDTQPPGYMNFPLTAEEKYSFKNYFSHFEAEKKITEQKDGGIATRWIKKDTNVQNHLFDCRCYNMVVRDILLSIVGDSFTPKVKNLSWRDYCNLILKKSGT